MLRRPVELAHLIGLCENGAYFSYPKRSATDSRRIGDRSCELPTSDNPGFCQAESQPEGGDFRVKPAVIDLIPAELAREHRYIPLTVREEPEGRVLFLGMQDPGDLDALDNVSFRIGWKVKPILVAPSELEEALERYYPSESADPRDRMLDLDPPENDGSPATAESAQPVEPVAATAPPDDSAISNASEAPDVSETLEVFAAPNDSGAWDVSEECEVTAEPEFLLLEEVVQAPVIVPDASLGFGTDSGHAMSEAARSKLAQLVMALVEEGILDREELIERLSSTTENPA